MKKLILTFAASTLFSLGFGQTSTSTCPGFQADFTTVTHEAAGGIKFTDASQVVGNAPFTSQWDFGNSTYSTETSPFALFEEGTFQVSLTITDDNGCQSTIQKDVVFSYGGQ